MVSYKIYKIFHRKWFELDAGCDSNTLNTTKLQSEAFFTLHRKLRIKKVVWYKQTIYENSTIYFLLAQLKTPHDFCSRFYVSVSWMIHFDCLVATSCKQPLIFYFTVRLLFSTLRQLNTNRAKVPCVCGRNHMRSKHVRRYSLRIDT